RYEQGQNAKPLFTMCKRLKKSRTLSRYHGYIVMAHLQGRRNGKSGFSLLSISKTRLSPLNVAC
ncbi:hypothetical protein LZ656_23880, partial [Leclercia adecarboxylata]|uniref:hypothetical protein n=1 Tax=Leclercia adecarboxylata TaxID=83655 RepID=UPI001F1E901B